MLLRESLGTASCHTTMIAHVSDEPARHAETLSTVQLATRVHRLRRKKLKVGPISCPSLPPEGPRLAWLGSWMPSPAQTPCVPWGDRAEPTWLCLRSPGCPDQNWSCFQGGLSGWPGQPGGIPVACAPPRPGPLAPTSGALLGSVGPGFGSWICRCAPCGRGRVFLLPWLGPCCVLGSLSQDPLCSVPHF